MEEHKRDRIRVEVIQITKSEMGKKMIRWGFKYKRRREGKITVRIFEKAIRNYYACS